MARTFKVPSGDRRNGAGQQSSSGVATHNFAPTIIRDLRGNIADWNCAAEKRYGFSKMQAVGKVSHQLLRTVFPSPLSEINRQLLEREVWEGELIHTVSDGERVKVVSRWELYTDAEGVESVREINNVFEPVAPEDAQLLVPTLWRDRYRSWGKWLARLRAVVIFLLPFLAAAVLLYLAMHAPASFAPLPHR